MMTTVGLKGVQPSMVTKMHSFRTATLWLMLLGVSMMGHLISGHELRGDSYCSTCPRSVANESFTVRNALPLQDRNLYMVCSFTDECGKLTVQPPIDITCNSVEIAVNAEQSTCACSSAPVPKTQQILCEFVYTRTGNTPNSDETFWRAQVLVWSRGTTAPKKTYYKVDSSGFWFSNSVDGQLTLLGGWPGWNYLSKEAALKGSGNTYFATFGPNHCRKSSITSYSH